MSENKNNKNRKHQKYKYVKVDKKRPKLTKGAYSYNKQHRVQKRKPVKNAAFQKDKNAKMNIIPLGGLDGIGKNMTVFECENDMILDDAGLMFPDDNHPGIDLILPDYTYVLENVNKLKGIVITHGHEDHIGALPYLIQDLDKQVPIYGTKLTIGLIKCKFDEFGIKNINFVEIGSGDSVEVGHFKISFFSVNHSIPGALGIFIQSPAGNVLHTGDFKLDQTPIDGVITDFNQIAKFSKVGIDLMMSDSTNAVIDGFTKSESVVGPELERIISKAKGKVVIASFASHIHRIQQVCDAACKNGRKVVVTGRSMIQNTEIARKLGYLHVDDENIIDAYELNNIAPEKVVVLCTGSQGEPLSALARIAKGSHKTISLYREDTVIISATPVPGNEKAVADVTNMLAKIGVEVYDKSTSTVHVSGHASSEELKLMIALCNPCAFIPVHGETVHLLAHAKLAHKLGVDADKIFICDNGDVVELSTSGVKLKDTVESGVVFVDGLSVGDTSEDVLSQRNDLMSNGIAVVSAAINLKSKSVCGKITVKLRGVSGADDDLTSEIESSLANALSKGIRKSGDYKYLRKIARDTLLSMLWQRTKQRPMFIIDLINL